MNITTIHAKANHIVISWNSYGRTERAYVAVQEAANGAQIENYIHEAYGKEQGQTWRPATPVERERHEFKYVELAPAIPTFRKFDRAVKAAKDYFTEHIGPKYAKRLGYDIEKTGTERLLTFYSALEDNDSSVRVFRCYMPLYV